MADLPIGSDEGVQPVEILQASTQNKLVINSDGSLNASLGSSDGKSVIMKTGTLVTTALTANQIILTYTVTSGKIFYMEYVGMEGALTAPSGGTNIILGVISLENPSGTKVISRRTLGGGGSLPDQIYVPFAEPIPVPSATIIRITVTPNSTTSMTWYGNFGGYEK